MKEQKSQTSNHNPPAEDKEIIEKVLKDKIEYGFNKEAIRSVGVYNSICKREINAIGTKEVKQALIEALNLKEQEVRDKVEEIINKQFALFNTEEDFEEELIELHNEIIFKIKEMFK